VARPLRAQGFGQHREKLRLTDGFGERDRETALAEDGLTLVHTHRGQHHHREVRQCGDRSNLVRQLEAVHARHLEVEQRQVERAASHVGGPQHGEGGRPIGGGAGVHAPAAKLPFEDQPIRLVVIHDQGAGAGQRRARGRHRQGHGLRAFQRNDEPEGAAPPWLAVHPDLAAHQAHELARDGEPETGTAVAARGGAVGLGERLEQPRTGFV
jgi:hypothetical protein